MTNKTIKITLVVSELEKVNALKRFLHFVLDIKYVDFINIRDHFNFRRIFESTFNSDLIIFDGFLDGISSQGFQWAKFLDNKTLILFYDTEISIEKEGAFWLLLPKAIDRLSIKILDRLDGPSSSSIDFESLENRFDALRERDKHYKMERD